MKIDIDAVRFDNKPLLSIQDLDVTYYINRKKIPAVRQANFDIQPGEAHGLVGESGSGKSTIAYAIMRYLDNNGKITRGKIIFQGKDIYQLNDKELMSIRGDKISLVPQDPLGSLNQSHRIGDQISEILKIHYKLSNTEAYNKTIEILEQVYMPLPRIIYTKYPHELSGGQQQRVLIAMAFCTKPDLLIMDEPTTGLDATTAVRITDLIIEMKKKYNSSILYITHNLGIITRFCDRVTILYAGEIVEEGPAVDVFEKPRHPYTSGLLGSIPRVNLVTSKKKLNIIEGFLPDLTNLTRSCIFSPRCNYTEKPCFTEIPPMVLIDGNRMTKCFFYEKLATSSNANSVSDDDIINKDPIFSNDIEILLKVDHLKKVYTSKRGKLRALDGPSFVCNRGEVLGIVGESGCGKTSLAKCIVGLLDIDGGHILFNKQNIGLTYKKRSKRLLQKIQMIFQNPNATLNPQKTISQILGRPLILYKLVHKSKLKERIIELLESVNLNENYLTRYPHEISGGEAQRIGIARAFALIPELVICDEPISNLDVSVQSGILNLISNLHNKYNMTSIFISHDLNVIYHISDKIIVMYLGKICEMGKPDEIFLPPYHPYTEALLSAIPTINPNIIQKKIRLEGSVPIPIDPIHGCVFHTRCPRKIGDICEKNPPPEIETTPNHIISCHIQLKELMNMTPVFNYKNQM
jgi:peptide/nickel transport system ATP-binding protein